MRRHLTYANVVATLALVVAVGGGSTAIAISAKKAPKNSVTSKAIRDGSVTAKDLAPVRVQTISGSDSLQTEICRSGERLLNGGAGGNLTGFGPTPDGRGFNRFSSGLGGFVTIACLSGKPGR